MNLGKELQLTCWFILLGLLVYFFFFLINYSNDLDSYYFAYQLSEKEGKQ